MKHGGMVHELGKKMKKRSVKISRKLQVIFFLGHGRNSGNVIVNYLVIS